MNDLLQEEFEDYIIGKYSDNDINIEGSPFSPITILKSDEDTYNQAIQDWKTTKVQSILQCISLKDYQHICKNNIDRFNRVKKILNRNKVVPFIGAGLSIPCGKPGWFEFLSDIGNEQDISMDEMYNLFYTEGKPDTLAEQIIKKVTERGFDERLRNIFDSNSTINGCIQLIPKINDKIVITSNFDHILEGIYKENNKAFSQIILGNEQKGIIRAMAEGERSLLKIHGHIGSITHRVLTNEEYNNAYGRSSINFDLTLPKTLRQIYLNNCLLFLGCSLCDDRTMDVFKGISENEGKDIPPHYAILELPNNLNNIGEREIFLNERNIYPIWYPKDSHENVEYIIKFLLDDDIDDIYYVKQVD